MEVEKKSITIVRGGIEIQRLIKVNYRACKNERKGKRKQETE